MTGIWLSKVASFLDRVANPVSRAMSGVGAGVLAVMMFLSANRNPAMMKKMGI